METKKKSQLVNPIEIRKLHLKLKNALLTKEWDIHDTALSVDTMDKLIDSYEIMFLRYFNLLNLDISDLEKMKDLYFIDETEAQLLFVDEERH